MIKYHSCTILIFSVQIDRTIQTLSNQFTDGQSQSDSLYKRILLLESIEYLVLYGFWYATTCIRYDETNELSIFGMFDR